MSLPNVSVNIMKSGKGYSLIYDDGCCGLLANGEAVTGKISLDTPFCITQPAELEALGITSSTTGANANVYKCVMEFYHEAPMGSALYIMLEAVGVKIDDFVDAENQYVEKLVEYSRGSVRTIMVKVTDAVNYEPTIDGGLDELVYDAVENAQATAETIETSMRTPLLILLEGRHWTGDPEDLDDLSEMGCNRVAVVVGDTTAGEGVPSVGACVGLVCGRIAAIPVQRSIARVKDGPIKIDDVLFLGAKPASLTLATAVSDKGFICPRIFIGMDGYYWSDDKLATAASDDYCSIARRRVIDKCSRLLNIILHERLNDEVAISSGGLLNSAWVTGLETEIKSVLLGTMGAEGNIGSVDDTEDGVEVYIDLEQDVVTNNGFEVEVSIMPYGYGKYIVANLRFDL